MAKCEPTYSRLNYLAGGALAVKHERDRVVGKELLAKLLFSPL